MFDFAWSEILLIGAVALIAIGPKDMPAAIRTVSGLVKKARRMAGDFQTHVDEMVREADLGDVKKAFNDLRTLDIPSAFERAVDPDRSIRKNFEDDPLAPNFPTAGEATTLEEPAVTAPLTVKPLAEQPVEPDPSRPLAPAFIPPNMVPKPATKALASPLAPPPFIPPEAVLQLQSKSSATS